MSFCSRLGGAIFLTVAFLACAATGAEADKAVTHHFKIVMTSKMDMEIPGQKQKLDAETQLRYSWTRSGSERVLQVESMLVKANSDGKPMMDTFMSRDKFTAVDAGKKTELSFEQAPEPLKQMLQATFDVPLFKLQRSDDGEVKRIVLVGPAAKSLVDNGLIVNCLLFHPPFVRNSDKWNAEAQATMGNGGFAKGNLEYVKTAPAAEANVVKVSGTLLNKEFKAAGTPLTIKDATYVVEGDEKFDPAQKEWTSGKLMMDVSFKLAVEEKPTGSAKGQIVLDFERVPDKTGDEGKRTK